MYGKFFYLSTGAIYDPLFNAILPYTRYSREVTKIDSDTTLSYNITNFFKVFAGYKYQVYTYTESERYLAPEGAQYGIYSSENTARHVNMGPGIGVGFTVPLYKSLFLLF